MLAIPWDKLQSLELDLVPEFKRIFDKVGVTAANALPGNVPFSFNKTDPNSLEYIREHAAELVRKNILPNSQEAIRQLINRSFTEGIPPAKVARMIKPHIGLLPAHEVAVDKYYKRLLADGKSEAAADKLRQRYANRLLNYRANNIARTESINASAMGQVECWQQSIADGSLDPHEWERVWIADETERTCAICQALARGPGAPLTPRDAPYPGTSISHPTAHPSCRCVEGLREKEVVEAKPSETMVDITGTPSGEFLSEANSVINGMPGKVLNDLEKSGYRFKVGERLTDINPHLRGYRPRGWPKGMTWDNADGCFSYPQKAISVAEQVKIVGGEFTKSPRIKYVVSHETGHAIDEVYKLSSSPEFIKAYNQDTAKFSGRDKGRFGYFLQAGSTGPEETAAEGFTSLLGHSGHPDFASMFSNVCDIIKKAIS